jgi:hypothetical protein
MSLTDECQGNSTNDLGTLYDPIRSLLPPPKSGPGKKVCHRIIALFKRWLLGTYQGAVRPEHLDYYLDEYTFRFNRRTSRSRGKLFYRLVQQAVQIEPVTGKEIEGGKRL